ncbi:hypothetical protein [Streptomyces sp. NPDC101776]|uniref:hypothetical protein n=1 Tax=Streptomyces sp. NPDC101776 TaxID=3366146 RepID=UPI00381EE6EB
MQTRSTPTPSDLVERQAEPDVVDHQAEPDAPSSARSAALPYDRRLWEQAVLASDLYVPTRLIALVLAHHADASGHIPAGGPQSAGSMARECAVEPKTAQRALVKLENDGYLTRPDIRTWTPRYIRPITLTLPTAAARTEPPHTGEVPE